MAWRRYHYHCEACRGSWLAEADVETVDDCRFCGARDIFPYKSDGGRVSRAKLAVVEGARKAGLKAARAGKLKRSA
ncbi:MAG TPA: hypothetical protein VFA57_11405 [Pseudolabrys sp.]|nr:hypothetical protein [Pseudolabrys sp.]